MTNGTHRATESKNNYHERRRALPLGTDLQDPTMTNVNIKSLQTKTSPACNLENNPPENCKNRLGLVERGERESGSYTELWVLLVESRPGSSSKEKSGEYCEKMIYC